eukprot:1195479-Prorocentrum_minimum.AAC.3
MGLWGVVCTLVVTGTGGPMKTNNPAPQGLAVERTVLLCDCVTGCTHHRHAAVVVGPPQHHLRLEMLDQAYRVVRECVPGPPPKPQQARPVGAAHHHLSDAQACVQRQLSHALRRHRQSDNQTVRQSDSQTGRAQAPISAPISVNSVTLCTATDSQTVRQSDSVLFTQYYKPHAYSLSSIPNAPRPCSYGGRAPAPPPLRWCCV